MLTLRYVKNSEIHGLKEDSKIKKLINYIKDEKIVLLEGGLTAQEETKLIQNTMEQISRKFKGIEIASIKPNNKKNIGIIEKIRLNLSQFLLGHQGGMTIIGPATIIKEIKKDPNKIELLTKGGGSKK
jgi:hypothetical protein